MIIITAVIGGYLAGCVILLMWETIRVKIAMRGIQQEYRNLCT